MRGLSIDVGIRNLAIYVEEFDPVLLQKYSNKKIINNDSKKSYKIDINNFNELFDKNHLPTSKYAKILNDVYMNGTCVFIDLVNLTSNENVSAKFVTTDILLNLTDYLEKHKSLWDTCSFVIIEQQMNTRFKKNTSAQHIQHHIHSWFIYTYRDFKLFINYPSKNKSQILGAPTKVNKKKKNGDIKYEKRDKAQLKKWSENIGLDILGKRTELPDPEIKQYYPKDTKNSLIIEKYKNPNKIAFNKVALMKKKDDVCDALIQLQSFKIKLFILKQLK